MVIVVGALGFGAVRLAGEVPTLQFRALAQDLLTTFTSLAAPTRGPAQPGPVPNGQNMKPALTPTPVVQQATGPVDPVTAAGVAELNRYRVVANVPPVVARAQSAAGLHAHYLALNKGSQETAGLGAHTEQQGLPGYTLEGDAVARVSNISEGYTTVESAVRGLVDVPLHRHGMLSPLLTDVGVGADSGFWVFDLSSAGQLTGKPQSVTFPAHGQAHVPLVFPGHETPNPLTAIPGIAPDATLGYAITLSFYGCNPGAADASLSTAGQPVPIFVVQPGAKLSAEGGERLVPSVILFPRGPLAPSTTYKVSIRQSCGSLGTQSYGWTFTTRAGVDPAATEVAVSPPLSDGWQVVVLRVLDTEQHPIGGAHLRGWKGKYTSTSEVAAEPQFRYELNESLDDGILRFAFKLAGADAATLEIGVETDGQSLPVPVSLTAAPNDRANSQAYHAIPIDPAERASWQR